MPATKSDLARLESHIGVSIPSSLKELLSEVNGIQLFTSVLGEDWQPLFFSVDQMLNEVVNYLEESGNPMPPPADLRSIVFFSHYNGFAYLYGICLRDFAEFCVGDVVSLGHDSGELTKVADSIEQFMSDPYSCLL